MGGNVHDKGRAQFDADLRGRLARSTRAFAAFSTFIHSFLHSFIQSSFFCDCDRYRSCSLLLCVWVSHLNCVCIVISSQAKLFSEHSMGLGWEKSDTCFDCYVDTKTGKWEDWTNIIEDFQYDPATPYFNILVPTADTTRCNYMLELLMPVMIPLIPQRTFVD